MEDVSEKSEEKMREHLVNLVRNKKENKKRNPWFDELWATVNLTGFKIDSKVENVMNVAVLYSETFKNYSKTICPRNGKAQLNASCVHERFNGTNFFNKFILNARGENLYEIFCETFKF